MRRYLALFLVVLGVVQTPAAAETIWDMPTEYPQTAMPGQGLTIFARKVRDESNGEVIVRPSFEATAGIKSAEMLKAVAGGGVQAGDAFSSAMEAEDPIFALPALPFLATSIDQANTLAHVARPYYAAALEKKGLRLLYLTPWPPTGIWSKQPLTTPEDMARLTIRTYDAISREVLAGVGARAETISFADTMPRLINGSLDAVLSSGDGGAGRKLWQYLPEFSEIGYAQPLSVAFVNAQAYEALAPQMKAAVDKAALDTEAELWLALGTRLQDNYLRMRQNGVSIDLLPPTPIIAALKSSAAKAQSAWCERAGPVCEELMTKFRAGRP